MMSNEWDDTRTTDSVYDALLSKMACSREVTGEISYERGVVRLTRAANNNKALDKALRTVASKMLEIFPVESKSPAWFR